MIFLYPYILFLSILILVPLLFHFKKKFNRKKIYFPYLFLFENEIKQEARRKKINKNLLLILRILIIILTVFFFAHPVKSKNTSKQQCITIFIDNTYSLLYRENNELLINMMKRKLISLTVEYPVNTIYNLIFADGKIKYRLQKNDYVNEISNINSVKENIDPQKVVEIFKRFIKENNNYENFLTLVSDFRKNRYKNFYFESNFFYHKIGLLNRRNVQITNISIFPRLYFNNENIDINFTLKNYSDNEESIIVRVFNENYAVFEKSYRLMPMKKLDTKAQITLKFGKNNFRFEITGDNFPYDDKVLLTINIVDNLRVLILGKNEIEKKLIANSFLIEKAVTKRNMIIDFIPKSGIYDIVILIGTHKNPPKARLGTVFFLKMNDDINTINSLIKIYTNALKIIELKREKVNLTEDRNFPYSLPVGDIRFNSYFIAESLLTSFFIIGNKKLIFVSNKEAFFLADIDFENSNILLSSFLPLIVDRLIYELTKIQIPVAETYFSNNENILSSITPPITGFKKNNATEMNNTLRILIFLILMILIIFETLASSRSLNVKKTIISG